MTERLNVDLLEQTLRKAGLNQSKLADLVEVSREAVSKWLKGESVPRPDKLLRLSIELDLDIDQLVMVDAEIPEPIVFFRKRGNRKTTDAHIARAIEMGWALRPLVPHLPFDQLAQPATLKQPSTDYAYVQSVASKIRTDIGLRPLDVLKFEQLIEHFLRLQTVLIPVLWGRKDHHENAIHIYLPDSFTTWVHLNLDVEVHDFKFWMAHELGHAQTPMLPREMGEDFADEFAGALLFPAEAAKQAFYNVAALSHPSQQINRLKDLAVEYTISPITIFMEANKFAIANGFAPLNLPGIYGAAQNLNKDFQLISEALFDGTRPDVRLYMETCERVFGTPVFKALAKYLAANNQSAGYVQNVLQVPMSDAKEIYQELRHAAKPAAHRQ